jgi:hypothetical protein
MLLLKVNFLMTTGHRMDGQDFESRKRQKTFIFSKRYSQLSGIYNLLFNGYADTSPGGKINRAIPIYCRSEESWQLYFLYAFKRCVGTAWSFDPVIPKNRDLNRIHGHLMEL